MIVGCSLLGSIQPYLWMYNPTTSKCGLRPNAEALWEVWSWTTEMIIFLAVPLVILIVNVLVMREVWRMSNAGPVAAAVRGMTRRGTGTSTQTQTHQSSGSTSKNAATNAMLLTISFYIIFTTLPATLVYVFSNVFPRPDFHGVCADDATTTGGPEDTDDWQRFVVYKTVANVVNEMCMSHYACNFFFYVATGREFRLALRRLFRGSVTDSGRYTQNGTQRSRHTVVERINRPANNEQRTPFVPPPSYEV